MNVKRFSFDEFGLFCNCTGYLAKERNRIHIIAEDSYDVIGSVQVRKKEYYVHVQNPNGDGYIDKPLEYEERVEKPLFSVKELDNKSFSGIIVGRVTVPVKEDLFVLHDEDPFQEHDYIDKTYTEFIDCFIVFYGNNRKRFVPVEMAYLIDEEVKK